MNIKTLFIDVGGVLVRTESTSKRREWEKRLHLKPRQLTREVYKIQPATEATTGLVTADKIWQNVGEKFSLQNKDLEKLRNDFFDGDRLNTDFYKFVLSIRKDYKIALFTNAWDDARETNIQRFHLDKICDNMIISAEVGMRKPHKKFFLMGLNVMNASASESVFVDDRAENIRAGREMGFQTVLFKSTDDAIERIKLLTGE